MPERTLADLLEAYRRDYLPQKSPKTQYQEGLLLDWIARDLGRIPLLQLTPLVLRTWRDSWNATYRLSTTRRYLTVLSAVLTAGVKEYVWLEINPLRKQRLLPSPQRGRERCLDADELQRLLAACQVSRNPHLPLVVLLALTTGARKNELLQRQWGDLDWERGLLLIAQSKNGDRRALILLPQLVAQLQAHRAQSTSAWVFPRADGRKPALLDYAWRTACARAGLVDFHFHDLRHTAASYLARSGASLREIAEILGHRTLTQTLRYTHLTEAHTRPVVEKMAKDFFPLKALDAPNPEED